MLSSFTHVDPFEDTERLGMQYGKTEARGFTHVDPFEDTESSHAPTLDFCGSKSFTHVDPFEDTES